MSREVFKHIKAAQDALDKITHYARRRDQALIALDEAYVSERFPDCPPDMRLTVLHKARYECTTIPPELRHESGAWLREKGYKRITGDEVLPEGELPR